jgi:acetyl-CoA acyltransferase 1
MEYLFCFYIDKTYFTKMDNAQRRLSHLANTLAPEQHNTVVLSAEETAASIPKSDEDIVIVSALRTPICRAKRGGFKDTHPTELLAAALKAVVDQSKIDVNLIQDVQVGNVLPPAGVSKTNPKKFINVNK